MQDIFSWKYITKDMDQIRRSTWSIDTKLLLANESIVYMCNLGMNIDSSCDESWKIIGLPMTFISYVDVFCGLIMVFSLLKLMSMFMRTEAQICGLQNNILIFFLNLRTLWLFFHSEMFLWFHSCTFIVTFFIMLLLFLSFVIITVFYRLANWPVGLF